VEGDDRVRWLVLKYDVVLNKENTMYQSSGLVDEDINRELNAPAREDRRSQTWTPLRDSKDGDDRDLMRAGWMHRELVAPCLISVLCFSYCWIPGARISGGCANAKGATGRESR